MKTLLSSVLLFAAVGAWAEAPKAADAAKPAETQATEAKASETKAVVKVEKIVVGTAVENRELTGEATTFGAEVGQVTCWTKLAIENPPAKVKYVWSMDDKKVSEYEADITLPTARWWAVKKVQPGAWKVEVLSEAGEALGSANFTVSAEAAAPKADEPAKTEAPKTGTK